MKKEVKLERSCRDSFTEEIRSNWFSKLKGILALNNLHACPEQIWNCDESGFSDETQCKFSFFLILKFLVLLQANMFAYQLTQSLLSNSKRVLVKHLQRCYCVQVQMVMFSRVWWSMPPKLETRSDVLVVFQVQFINVLNQVAYQKKYLRIGLKIFFWNKQKILKNHYY